MGGRVGFDTGIGGALQGDEASGCEGAKACGEGASVGDALGLYFQRLDMGAGERSRTPIVRVQDPFTATPFAYPFFTRNVLYVYLRYIVRVAVLLAPGTRAIRHTGESLQRSSSGNFFLIPCFPAPTILDLFTINSLSNFDIRSLRVDLAQQK